MDSSRKPEQRNPRQGAAPWSQLFFGWVVPILWRGCRNGLNTDHLTQCLPKDESTELGDKLETAWQREQETAKRKNRTPRLRRALFGVFVSSVTVDGCLIFIFVVVKTIMPVVLAQLLKQFQPSIETLNDLSSPTLPSMFGNDTTPPEPILQSIDSLNRTARSIDDAAGGASNQFDLDRRIQSFGDGHKNDSDVVRKPLPASNTPTAFSEKADELSATTVWPTIVEQAAYMWTNMLWLGTLLVVLNAISFLLEHHTNLRQQMVGARMRIACCSLIYRKTLRLSKKSAGRTAAGYLVNLLSNDVNRLDMGFVFAHYVWILPLQSCVVTYLIWLQVGAAAFVGVISLLLLTIPVQTGLSRLLSRLRMTVALRTDQRVGIMHEIIVGIQVIKMYAWERPFRAVVSEARRQEVGQIRFASYIRGINMCTMVFMERVTLFITIWACVMMGRTISADVVFSMAQFFNVLQLMAAIFYPLALALGAEALVSIDRVEEFLIMEERVTDDAPPQAVGGASTKGVNGATDKSKEADVESKALLGDALPMNGHATASGNDAVKNRANAIELRNITATWDEAAAQKTLQNVSFDVKKGTLCAIIGPVGAGKSSLLHLLLNELPLSGSDPGQVALADGTRISYGSQEPWLFSGTVRHNILFGQTYDAKRYGEVIQCCALVTDFEQLPHGDKTVVGERGTALSGGQRARISLARAVYKQANVYLLDDPLSAVDAHVGKHLFDEVIGPNGRLARLGHTRLLVTHQVHFLEDADVIVILDGGKILRTGTYAELANSELDFAQLLRKGVTDEEGDANGGTIGDSSDNDDDEDIPFIDGSPAVKVARRRRSRSESTRSGSNKSLSTTKSEDDDDDDINAEQQAEGGVALRVWCKYFRAGGTICQLLALLLMLLCSQIVTSGSDYFVNYWTQQEDRRLNGFETRLTQTECLVIYGLLIVGVIVVCFLRGYMFFQICMHASKVLHDQMFIKLLLAPMRFFDTNPSGRILNRFSKDMGAIDEMLPKAMMESIQIGLVMIGILVMVSIVNPLMIGVLCVAIAMFALILRLYLRASQDLKRLEGISRSPVFSHLSATLSGLSTIRSCGLQHRLAAEFDELQNVHSGVWQLATTANTALGLWLDCVSGLFVAFVTFSFIGLYGDTYSGNVGLAISQALILTGMVQYGVRQSAVSMQQMTAVERVLQYTDLVSEVQLDKQPPTEWPAHGRVQFRGMSLRYDPLEPPTLIDLTIDIMAGWKVGIVGRTGAGKSSLISALFRLAPISGEILIDDIETGTISLESLRSAVSIIPQDPVLFSATVRNNLDPFGRYTDEQLWLALSAVELRAAIPALDFMVTESGANFSVGQRQLICLARAILRNNRVLVLDEATANVDPQTDALIQRTIRERFAECTVLTVAHRLHTVMDSDRIVVMDAGRVREFDWPAVLLSREAGVLKDMVEATGPQEAHSLRAIAEHTMAAKLATQNEE